MTTISIPREWASSTNYAAGPDIGTPTKVDPGAALSAEGFEPGPVKAQHVNYVLNQLSKANSREVFNGALFLRRSAAAVVESSVSLAVVEGWTPGQPTMVIKGGVNDSWSIGLGQDRQTLVGNINASISSGLIDAARNGQRVVAIGSGGATRAAFSTDEGGTWAAGSNLGATPQAIVWNATQGRFLVTFVAGNNVSNDTDGASTWTSVSTGLTAAQGGIALLSGGNAVAGGCGASFPEFAISSNGGTTWSLSGSNVLPSFGDYTTGEAGWVAGNSGSKVFHAGRANGGTELRICSSTNGTTWTLVKTFTSPSASIGGIFAYMPRLLMCQRTGLLVVLCRVADGIPNTEMVVAYASADLGASWTEAATYHSAIFSNHNTWRLADGRLFATSAQELFISEGIR